jgi:misacylated tRNA(Ala) deacylase
MRTHTALHVLCGVVWRDYGAQVTGGNMEPGSGRMDFEFERMNADLIGAIETTLNAELGRGRQIRVNVLPRDEAFAIPDLIRTKVNLLPPGIPEIRTIEIVGLDLQADGGTHVANTSEVGQIRVTGYESKGRINKRIRIALADDSERHA